MSTDVEPTSLLGVSSDRPQEPNQPISQPPVSGLSPPPSAPAVSQGRWHLRRWASWTAGVLATICATLAGVGILVGSENGLELGVVLGGLASWLLMIWFFLVFAADLEPAHGHGGGVRVNEMVAFCYSFALFMLGASALGPIGFFQKIQTTQNIIDADFSRIRQADVKPGDAASEFDQLADKLEKQVITTDTVLPIAILPACVEAPNDASWELSCSRQRRQPDQWIVNIGGYVTNRIPDNSQHHKLQYALQGKAVPETLRVSETPAGTLGPESQNIANRDEGPKEDHEDALASGADPDIDLCNFAGARIEQNRGNSASQRASPPNGSE